MRAASAVVSLTTHVVVVVVAVWATVDAHTRVPHSPVVIELLPPPGRPIDGPVPSAPSVPVIDGGVALPPLELPTFGGADVALARPAFAVQPLPGPLFAVTPGTEIRWMPRSSNSSP